MGIKLFVANAHILPIANAADGFPLDYALSYGGSGWEGVGLKSLLISFPVRK